MARGRQASDETAALTEAIAKIERAIDERVAALYGLLSSVGIDRLAYALSNVDQSIPN